MTRTVVTVHPEDHLVDVRKSMQEQGVRHLPVVDGGKLVGIVSLNTIRDAAPSKATELSIHEVHYLLSKMKIREVMKKDVVTCAPDDHVEDIAKIMQTRRIGAVPVVDKGQLVGILTNDDMFRILMKMLGMDTPGKRITLEMERGQGEKLVDIVSPHPGRQTVILNLDDSEMGEVVDALAGLGFDVQSVDDVV
jgi:acetoin utilization protein AcuB